MQSFYERHAITRDGCIRLRKAPALVFIAYEVEGNKADTFRIFILSKQS